MTRLAPSSGYQDDVAVLLYRHPAPLEISFPAHVNELSRSRAALRSWLSQTRVNRDQAHDMLVAAGEAVANAIEHGHRDSPEGIITLRGTALVDQVQLTIVDTGSWKPPQTAAERHRGRGITLMRALMQDVAIHPDAVGTTVHLFARIT
jgi:anti-sigma regulatory factor (Ser/Thr protein kinase)